MELAYNRQRKYGPKARGTATTEFLVSLAVFVPLFITIPVIGKYISFKQKNIESSRYAVWERTVWSDEKGRWNDNENSKTDDGIAREVDRRLYGSQIQGMASSNITDNTLWTDRNHKRMLALAPKDKHRISVTVSADVSPVKDHFTDNLAYKGIPYIGDGIESVSGIIDSTLGQFVSDCKDLPGVDFKHGMNLGSKTYASITVAANAKNMAPMTQKTSKDKNNLTFSSSGSILSNAWTAPTEAIFNERVGKLVVDESVRCLASPARLISIFFPYKEGKAARSVASAEKSTVLLDAYKK
jgi:hypothetical protein